VHRLHYYFKTACPGLRKRQPATYMRSGILVLTALAAAVAAGSPAQAVSRASHLLPGPARQSASISNRSHLSALTSSTPADVVLGSGPVVSGPITIHAIFWEPKGIDSKYDAFVTRFLGDLNDSSLIGLLRYYPGPGVDNSPSGAPGPSAVLGGTWSDTTTPFPKAHIGTRASKIAFRNEVQHAISTNLWPTGPGNVFMVFTGRGYQAGLTAGLCGEHSWYLDAPTGNIVPYAYIPRPGLLTCTSGSSLPINPTPSGSVRIDGAVSTGWHELAEMLTDPQPNTGYSDSTQGEIADICRFVWPNVTGRNHHNVVLNGHDYLVQGIWVRPAGGCVVSDPPDLSSGWTDFSFGQAPSTAVQFTVNGGSHRSTLEVTDAFCQGDRFTIWDNGKNLGPTSYVSNIGCAGPNQPDPQTAFMDGGWSAGTYVLPKGTQQISIQVIQNAAGTTDGDGFFTVSSPITIQAAHHAIIHRASRNANG
jgi:hypothetical protein